MCRTNLQLCKVQKKFIQRDKRQLNKTESKQKGTSETGANGLLYQGIVDKDTSVTPSSSLVVFHSQQIKRLAIILQSGMDGVRVSGSVSRCLLKKPEGPEIWDEKWPRPDVENKIQRLRIEVGRTGQRK